MRTFFLFLSRQKHLRKWMESSGWVGMPYVPGWAGSA
jgi:hypothetical protein